MADMHVGRGSLCTAMQGYMLWAVGGRDAHTFHSSTECFHPGQNRWTWGPPTLTKRFAAASGFLNNAIYITGGFDASAYTGTGERMDPREGKCTPVSDYPHHNLCECICDTCTPQITSVIQHEHSSICTRASATGGVVMAAALAIERTNCVLLLLLLLLLLCSVRDSSVHNMSSLTSAV